MAEQSAGGAAEREDVRRERDLQRLAGMPFGHSVGFLVSQTGDATARSFKAALARVDIEPRHFALLRAIEAAENRSQQALAETLHIPASSVVALLDQLETRRAVRRHHDPADRRVHVVELTASGRSLLRRATQIAMAIELQACEGLAGDERELLIAMLGRVARNLGLWTGVHPALGHGHGDGDGDGDGECAMPAVPPARPRNGRPGSPTG